MITGSTQLLGVIGDPISHSDSPLIHNAMLSLHEIDMVYLPFHVKPEKLQETVQALKSMNVRGFNVTVPHKESILQCLDEVDESALQVGAVNTVINEKGRLIGYNTDGRGFLFTLKEQYGFDLRDKHVCILGSGGTAKALSLVCASQGISKLSIINRTLTKAQQLGDVLSDQSDCSIEAFQLNSDDSFVALEGADLIIQTTSVGMILEECPLNDFKWVSSDKICYDVIYKPRKTRFLTLAEEAGAKTINGVHMLVAQAMYAYTLFTGTDADYAVMLQQLSQG
ncbi:shikimate dehydrogenase [Candidatus Marinamargulisbacteria bacterium SCGC AG-343-D04]|nr:shikimate dehydrogenase [Candidatus Marinamargulisbacteria bacterium SCGC AG-343-D04]